MSEPLQSLAANRPLLLSDLASDARIVEGEIGVFALDGEPGEEAVRHPLFTLGHGDVLCGVPRVRGALALLAVPLGATEIRSVPEHEAAEALQGWARQLARLADTPTTDLPPAEAGRLALEAGQQVYLEVGGWIQVLTGSANWMGQAEPHLSPELGLVPLGAGCWLEANEPTECLLLEAGAITTAAQLEAGRTALATLARPLVATSIQQRQRQSAERVAAWIEAETLAHEAAHRNLAAILAPDTEGIPGGNPLFAALTAIGGAAGITFRKPAPGGSGTRDPLQAIARASHIRYRFVRLDAGWWRHDNGPLLAWDGAEHRPIALLPNGAGRYRYVDPTRRATGPVDAAVAASLRPEAVMFYRPFPDARLTARDLLDFAWHLIRADARVIVAVAILSALLGIAIPQTIFWLMTTVIPSGDRSLLVELGIALFVVSATIPVLRLVQDFAVLRAEVRAESALEAALWDRVLGARLSFFRTKPSGELAQRMGTIGQLRRMLAGTTVQSIVSGVFSVTFLAQLFLYSTPMALAGLGVGLLLVLYMALSAKLVVRERQRVSRPAANTQAQVIELIDGLAKIRGAKAESRAFANAVQSYSLREREDFLAQAFQDRLSLLIDLMPILSTALFYAGFAAQADAPGSAPQIGAFIAFSAAFSGFLTGAQGMGNAVVTLINSEGKWSKL
ncbi:MAG TPA: ABC transporter transmembrane domain-containing protein, partial [Stenomitos sp.]